MQWERYELRRSERDSFLDDSCTAGHRIGTYPTRWLANFSAARRIQASFVGGSPTVQYVVREIPPRVAPRYWPELTVLRAPRWRPVPSASVLATGSGYVHTSIGFTRWHALGRACRWANRRSERPVGVGRWAGEPPTAGP